MFLSREGVFMRVLITGSGGQLGGALLRTAPDYADLNTVDVEDVDFTDMAMLRARLAVEAPDVIINAAAYTDFETAQSEESVAREINADAVAVLVEAVEETGGRLVQVSCDCVFDGTAARAYKPDDATNPLSALGRTKAEGEAHLRPKDLLVRSSWLYEEGGRNLVCAMIEQMRECEEIVAPTDEINSPTWATGLARTIWELTERKASGIFHHSDAGVLSRYDFARAIAEEAQASGLIDLIPRIRPVTSGDAEAGQLARRFSPLDCSATRALLGDERVDWRTNLRLMLQAEARLR